MEYDAAGHKEQLARTVVFFGGWDLGMLLPFFEFATSVVAGF